MKPKINTGLCLVKDCGNQKLFKGLCAAHISQQKSGKADYSSLITSWEVERTAAEVCGLRTYQKRLRTILRGVKVSRAQRSAFNTALIDAYLQANPDEKARAEQ